MGHKFNELIGEYYGLSRDKKWDEAIVRLEKCRELEPANTIVHSALVEAYSFRGKIKDVIQEYLRYLEALALREEQEKIRPLIPRVMSLIMDRENIIKKLITIAKRARLTDEYYLLLLYLARHYLSLSRDKSAKESSKKLVVRRDVLHVQEDKDDLAKEILTEVYDRKPESTSVQMELGRLFARLKMPHISMTIFQEALSASMKKGETENIDSLSQQIRVITNSELMVHLVKGEVYYHQNEYDRAADEFSNALKLDKYHSKALLGLANVLLAQEQYDLSVKAYTRAISLNPDEIGALRGIGMAYWKLGDTFQAARHLLDAAKILLKKAKYREAFAICTDILEFDSENLMAINIIDKLKTSRQISREEAEKALAKPTLVEPKKVLPRETRKTEGKAPTEEKKPARGLFRSGASGKKPPKGLLIPRLITMPDEADIPEDEVEPRDTEEEEEADVAAEEEAETEVAAGDEEELDVTAEDEEVEEITVEEEEETEATLGEEEEELEDTSEDGSEEDTIPEETAGASLEPAGQEPASIPLQEEREEKPPAQAASAEKKDEKAASIDGGGYWDWFWEEMVIEKKPEKKVEKGEWDWFWEDMASEKKEELPVTRENFHAPLPPQQAPEEKEERAPSPSGKFVEQMPDFSFVDTIVSEAVNEEIQIISSLEMPPEEGKRQQEEIEKLYQNMEKSLDFDESALSMGIFSTDGRLVWKSAFCSDESYEKISMNQETLISFFRDFLFSRPKTAHHWTVEFEKNVLTFYFLNSQFYVLLQSENSQKLIILREKLRSMQSKLLEILSR